MILECLRNAVSIKKLLSNYLNFSDICERASGFRGDSERENLYQFRMALNADAKFFRVFRAESIG